MIVYTLTGSLIVLFFLLASLNGLKKYVKSPIIKAIAKQHRLFGFLATTTAFLHMGYAVSQGNLRPTGAVTLLALILTGTFGALFSKSKNKTLYILHRIMGPLTLVLIIVHVILNSEV
jgi:hypothetical protein